MLLDRCVNRAEVSITKDGLCLQKQHRMLQGELPRPARVEERDTGDVRRRPRRSLHRAGAAVRKVRGRL